MTTVKPRSRLPGEAVQIEGIQIVLGCNPLKRSIFKLACRGFYQVSISLIPSNLVAIALRSLRHWQLKTQNSEWVE